MKALKFNIEITQHNIYITYKFIIKIGFFVNKILLFLIFGCFVGGFASDIDGYIRKLQEEFSTFGDGKSRVFFSLNADSPCEQIKIDKDVYYFVNETHVFECHKEGLTELNEKTGRFIDIINGWIKRFKISTFLVMEPQRIAHHRNGSDDSDMFGYHREPFLKALDEPVVVCDSWDFLKVEGLRDFAEMLTASGGRAVPSFRDSDVACPVAPVTQRHVTRSQTSSAEDERIRLQKMLEARRNARKVSVDVPASSVTAAAVEDKKPKKKNNRHQRKGKQLAATVPTADSEEDSDGVLMEVESTTVTTALLPVATTTTTAGSHTLTLPLVDPDGDVVMKIKPSPQDSKPVLMEEESAEEDPMVPPLSTLAAVLPQHKGLMQPDIIVMGETVKGLTPAQRMAIETYAGTGWTYQQQYEQARSNGLLATLRSPTPARSAARSVSRANSRMRRDSDVEDVSRLLTSSRSTSRMRGASEEEVMRSMTPARIRPLTVSFESNAVQEVYERYFSLPGNEAANARYREFLQEVSKQGASYYIGDAKSFKSITGAFKLKISDEARITFKRAEGNSLIIIGNPKHYGD